MEMKPLVLDLRSMIKNFNGEYDEGDEYVFDNVEVTKDIWEKLTERFLYIDEDGIRKDKKRNLNGRI